jgi:DOMON domain
MRVVMKIKMEKVKIVFFCFAIIFTMACKSQQIKMKTIKEKGMVIQWFYQNERVYFEMQAPTTGWVAIGFNTSSDIEDTYLLMGNVINGKSNVVEHYTINPGNYKPVSILGIIPKVQEIQGIEKNGNTTIKFSLPIGSDNKYQRDLKEGLDYMMVIAYSREDDFQHHSIMRSVVKITL